MPPSPELPREAFVLTCITSHPFYHALILRSINYTLLIITVRVAFNFLRSCKERLNSDVKNEWFALPSYKMSKDSRKGVV